MAEQTAAHRATEHFENAVTALRLATTRYQKAASGQPWTVLQAALEEMLNAQERYDRAEGALRQLLADLEAAKTHRLS